MAMLRKTVPWLVVYGVCGAALAGVTAVGCGGDDTTPSGEDSGSMPDVTTQTDAMQTTDTGRPDTTTQPEAAAETSTTSDASDASDATAADVQADVARDTGREAAAEAGAETGADGGNGADASDARADVAETGSGSDASEAGSDASDAAAPSEAGGDAAADAGACVTTVVSLGGPDAGTGDAGPPALLFSFDQPVGLPGGWSAFTDFAHGTASLGQNLADGYLCDGSLELNLTYSTFGPTAGAIFNYRSTIGSQDWTNRSRLHMHVKLLTSDYTLLGGVQTKIDSNNFSGGGLFGQFLSATSISSGGWVELITDLTPGATYVPNIVDAIEIQVYSAGSSPDGGSTAPGATTLRVDGIWLE